MEYINAGHPSPLLLRQNTVQAPFPAECCPVGLIADQQFVSSRVQLLPGDTLVLFSDGVSEALDPEQNEFGVGRLKSTLEEHLRAPITELQEKILESVRQFARGARQADDITLLLLRFTAGRPSPAVTDTDA
jgi:phosphoserine phosphatase RsbU/P